MHTGSLISFLYRVKVKIFWFDLISLWTSIPERTLTEGCLFCGSAGRRPMYLAHWVLSMFSSFGEWQEGRWLAGFLQIALKGLGCRNKQCADYKVEQPIAFYSDLFFFFWLENNACNFCHQKQINKGCHGSVFLPLQFIKLMLIFSSVEACFLCKASNKSK